MKIKTHKLVYYSDPGHGWVKVPLALLDKLGIRHKISHCSYMRGNYAYLEEDGDLSTLHKAIYARNEELKLVDRNTQKVSKIRSYPGYSYHAST
jgi:hypothetical protein